MYDWYRRLLHVAALLALSVIMLGAWVRLTDAGLGCPDWPGCYGQLMVPKTADQLAAATAAFPHKPVEPLKARNEMIHRYLASTLGFAIVVIAGLALANRRDPRQPLLLPLLLLGVVIFQGLLGMWTVTLLVKPLIVVTHLLGGLTTLGLSFWLILEAARRAPVSAPRIQRSASVPALVALLVVIVQIALGGWTSTNYAALACPELPTCVGEWWPQDADFGEAFVLWRGLGINYEGGVLDHPARVAIHFTHRLGAVIAALALALAALFALRAGGAAAHARAAASAVLAALVLQWLIGVFMIWQGFPLLLATAHNAGAALLLLATVWLNFELRETLPLRLTERMGAR